MNVRPFVVSASDRLAGPVFPLDEGFDLQTQCGTHMESCSPESWPYNCNNCETAPSSVPHQYSCISLGMCRLNLGLKDPFLGQIPS